MASSSVEQIIIRYGETHARVSSLDANRQVAEINGWWDPDEAAYDSEGNLTLTGATVVSTRDAVLTAILAKIPTNTPKVLDVGCGDGRLGVMIAETRPDIGHYRGIDLSLESIQVAQTHLGSVSVPGGMTVEYEAANVWEHLDSEITGDDWFIVSSRCLCDETRRMDDRDIIQLIDAKGARGWFIWGNRFRMLRPDVQYVMEQARINSASVSDYYFSESKPSPRAFLIDEYAFGSGPFAPAFLNRTGGYTNPPAGSNFVLGNNHKVVANGIFEQARAEMAVANQLEATTFTGVTVTGGKITGTAVKTIASESATLQAKVSTFKARRQLINTKKVEIG